MLRDRRIIHRAAINRDAYCCCHKAIQLTKIINRDTYCCLHIAIQLTKIIHRDTSCCLSRVIVFVSCFALYQKRRYHGNLFWWVVLPYIKSGGITAYCSGELYYLLTISRDTSCFGNKVLQLTKAIDPDTYCLWC
jgi:hypothetical protein